ncbi:3-hydroxyacyl-CoA dehydrogenase family protein [Streptomyces sp. WMMB 322]|uniref:3-hydroxyacyl-CoA dehydrogenase family protein n=1 Tax=Streptomyces sp. WMMB 322 TaxID=1286821 RepID=UPI000823A678|nr:3-hydroxyacyl-CoA dehydrogenase family protein [Streptomyces sp. WMMB 322]SCK46275.1 3-hydroxyacyl-CoA dehydrogenase [Streptomyces sp. WMMB 322]
MGERKDIGPARPVGVVGAGTMGAGVAQCFAQTGHRVVVVDPDAEARRGGAARLRAGLRLKSLLRGRQTDGARRQSGLPQNGGTPGQAEQSRAAEREEPADPAALVEFTADLSDLAQASFVVECAREREPLKEEILRALDELCPAETIFASCTSAIPIARLGSFTGRPDRVVGTHFMNPAPLKDAVEVARSPHTSDDTLARTLRILEGIGKSPLVVGDGPGFVTNRVLMLTVNEAAYVLHGGTADAETVDRVFQECFGHPMGPLRTGDLIGLDTVVDTLDVLREHTGDERFQPCPLLAELVADGSVGRKAGRGFHHYPKSPLVPRGETSHG